MNLQLRSLRKARGLTQSELAERIGTTMRVVSAWERCETSLPFEDACLIANTLECTLDELAGRECHNGKYVYDAYESELISCYRDSTVSRKGRILDTARDAAAMSKETAERGSSEPERKAV